MSQELSLVTDLAQRMRKVAIESPVQTNLTYMKMSKAGDWTFGKEKMEIEEDSTWAINPFRFGRGYVAWAKKGGILLGEEMALVLSEPAIIKSSLEEVGVDWKDQIGIELQCTSGEDIGMTALFKSSSLGAIKAYQGIFNKVLERAEAGESAVVPILTLESSSYPHPDYGEIFNPVFTIESWVTMEGITSDAKAPAIEAKPEPEPVVEPEPEPEPVAEIKPKRRRRKSAA